MIFDLPFDAMECAAIFSQEVPAIYYHEVAFVHDSKAFDFAFAHILDVEGTEFDRGGPSKFGITGPELARFRGVKRVTAEQIRNMTVSEARQLYYKFYWKDTKVEYIRSKLIATAVFDQTIHRGTFGGVAFLQKSINKIAGKNIVEVSGVMTAQTLDAVNRMNERAFFNAFVKEIQRSYTIIAHSKKSKRKYLRGWLNRTYALGDLLDKKAD